MVVNAEESEKFNKKWQLVGRLNLSSILPGFLGCIFLVKFRVSLSFEYTLEDFLTLHQLVIETLVLTYNAMTSLMVHGLRPLTGGLGWFRCQRRV